MRATLGAMLLALAVLPGSSALAGADLGEDTGLEHPKGDNLPIIAVVNFESKHAELKPAAKAILARVAKQLADNPAQKVELAGHTDSTGAEMYNTSLADRRAHSAGNYLVSHGVAAERLTMLGYGPYQPVDTNDTEAGRARNRRTEVKISP